MTAVGLNIRKRREELGLTQEELAKKLNYKSKSTINKIESGINDITQSKVVAFAEALNTTPSVLMGWAQPDPLDNYERFSQNRWMNEIYSILQENSLDREYTLFHIYRDLSPENKLKVDKYVKMIYDTQAAELALIDAAHGIPNSSKEDQLHDDDIMNDDNF